MVKLTLDKLLDDRGITRYELEKSYWNKNIKTIDNYYKK